MEYISNTIETSPGYSILLVASTFILLGFPVIGIAIAASLLYGMILLKDYLEHKKELDRIKTLDIELIGSSKKSQDWSKRSASDLLGEYVEECFNRDVLFFYPIQPDDYIDPETENKLLNELLDSAAANLSPSMTRKLGMYFGEDNVMMIIGRKCLVTVTLFVATRNSKIYTGPSNIRVGYDDKK